MKSCLTKVELPLMMSKNIIHQANEKMDEAIIQRFTNCMTDRSSRYYAYEYS
jgi:hypothetical protein